MMTTEEKLLYLFHLSNPDFSKNCTPEVTYNEVDEPAGVTVMKGDLECWHVTREALLFDYATRDLGKGSEDVDDGKLYITSDNSNRTADFIRQLAKQYNVPVVDLRVQTVDDPNSLTGLPLRGKSDEEPTLAVEDETQCCDRAKGSNGWHHNEDCPNWVLVY